MHKCQSLIYDAPDIYAVMRSQITTWRQTGELASSQMVTFINPYSYIQLRKNAPVLAKLSAVYCDAITSARFSSLVLNKTIPRISFDYGSLAKSFFSQMQKYHIPIYLLGSDPHSLSSASVAFTTHYPGLNITGTQHGYYADEEYQDILQRIVDSGAKFVVIGLGTPKQEQTGIDLIALANQQGKHIHCFTCGGFLTQSAQKLQYYPTWINDYHLRWLWRLFHEKHVWKRLLQEYPLFFIRFTLDYFKDKT